MIYKKNANFPYPVLTNDSFSYSESNFNLDVSLEENTTFYRLKYEYELTSSFLSQLLEKQVAQLIIIIQSRDNKYYLVNPSDTFIDIPKSRLSLSKRTSIQLQIQSKDIISFLDNDDLNDFYSAFKKDLKVPRHALLAYSNIVMFDGSVIKPFDLFEKRLNPKLQCEIKFELGPETIIIHYRDPEYQFVNFTQSSTFNNLYIYTGLSKALHQFIINYSDDDQEYVDLTILETPKNTLDKKLYILMKKKMVSEISLNTIDEVIYKISDRIVDRYVSAMKGLLRNGN